LFGFFHPLDIIGFLDLQVRVVIFGVLEIQIVDQETLFLRWWPLGQGTVGSHTLLGLVV